MNEHKFKFKPQNVVQAVFPHHNCVFNVNKLYYYIFLFLGPLPLT